MPVYTHSLPVGEFTVRLDLHGRYWIEHPMLKKAVELEPRALVLWLKRKMQEGVGL